MTLIQFNRPPRTGRETSYVLEAMDSLQMSGDGPFGRRCQTWFEQHLGCPRALLTPSCTHALEMCGFLLDIQPGDEVILPSFTFPSTANAFALRGARLVFVDIRPDTLNLDEAKLEAAVTERTRAIVLVHYAGVGCEMDDILAIAERHGVVVIEDAAQCIDATYKGRPLGTFGALSTFSFHETKNVTSAGEGGLLVINDESLVRRAEIFREKGTNRSEFFRGEVAKYSWVDLGSSYLPGEAQSAYLWGQLESLAEITNDRLATWTYYQQQLSELAASGLIQLPDIPAHCLHNGHIFHLRVADLDTRTRLLKFLLDREIWAVFHYVPLHSATAGEKYGHFAGEDIYTTKESERLVRLPLWYGMPTAFKERVVAGVAAFFNQSK